MRPASVVEWPSPAAYTQAVQVPSLLDPILAAMAFRDGFLPGLPLSFSGANAVVFAAVDKEGVPWAVRFFTTCAAAVPERYSAIERTLEATGVSSLARCHWLEEAVRVGGLWYPAVRMEWIDGVLLDQYVSQLAEAEASSALRSLATDWCTLVQDLQRHGIAHGDLQHGNVLVDRSTAALRLVDFDSVWVPDIGDRPPAEAGHPAYQHPDRRRSGAWGQFVDTFAGLVVHLSLLALAADPSLRRHTVTGSHLLLSERDLRAGLHGGSTTLASLLRSPDPNVRREAEALIELLDAPADSEIPLDNLLSAAEGPVRVAGGPSSAPAPDQRPTTAAADHEQWFEAGGDPSIAAGGGGDRPGVVLLRPLRPGEPGWHQSSRGIHPCLQTSTLPNVEAIEQRRRESGARTGPAGAALEPGTWWGEGSPAGDATPPVGTGGRTPGRARRLMAGFLDGFLGLTPIYLVVSLIFYAEGQAPAKHLLGLAVQRADGGVATMGRLLAREVALKQLPMWLLAWSLWSRTEAVSIPLLMALGGGVLTTAAGASPWDAMTGTRVVEVNGRGAGT